MSARFITGGIAVADEREWRKFAAGLGAVCVDAATDCLADVAVKGDAASGAIRLFAHAGRGGGVGLGERGGHLAAGNVIEFAARQRDAIGDAAGAAGPARDAH